MICIDFVCHFKHFNTIVLLNSVLYCNSISFVTILYQFDTQFPSAAGRFNKYSTLIWIVQHSIDNLCFNCPCSICIVECLRLTVSHSDNLWLNDCCAICYLTLTVRCLVLHFYFTCSCVLDWICMEGNLHLLYGQLCLPTCMDTKYDCMQRIDALCWYSVPAIPDLSECTVLMTLQLHYLYIWKCFHYCCLCCTYVKHYGGKSVNWYERNVIPYLNEPKVYIILSCVMHCIAIH